MKKLNFTRSDKLTKLSSGKLVEIISTDGEWATSLKDQEISELGYLISDNNLDEDVKPLFDEDDENPFLYNKAMKCLFIEYLFNIWEAETSIEYARLALQEGEVYEEKFDKSLIDFSEEEVIEAINGLGDKFSFYGLKYRIKIYKDYYNFYSKNYGFKEKDNLWAKYQTTKVLSQVLSVEEEEKNLTREDLVSLFHSMMNHQQGIIPLLIFEGINLSRIEERDELRHILKTDVSSDSILIRAYTDELDGHGFNLAVDRFIEIDEDVMRCVVKTVMTDSIIRINRHEFEYLELADTPYLLRSSMGRRPKEKDDSLSISYGGTYNRFKECRKQMESVNSEFDNFSTRYIANCGRSYYISRYMNEGLSETDAIIKTLKRFGEWNTIGNYKQDVKLDTNKIRIARLRRSYGLYN
ncbi:hypothetical protein DOK76_09175 [Vagococcus sp. DIV0080]|uniref:Uncharacterized protein n=1 Tax=Candidatus Vagococcus giribetii TaxID=2230876 RepID=A0ABS3HU55_9ENTE|nr:hypothetical protein [Vagococcus sp. DIV0080]MBO0477244.1 hypothetical protein [Vagococcus sp. DIV0080]